MRRFLWTRWVLEKGNPTPKRGPKTRFMLQRGSCSSGCPSTLCIYSTECCFHITTMRAPCSLQSPNGIHLAEFLLLRLLQHSLSVQFYIQKY